MDNTSTDRIQEIYLKQRAYFSLGDTLGVPYRKAMLRKLLRAISKYEKPLYAALRTDLHKSEQEAYLTEVSIVTGEIRNHIRHLNSWAAPENRQTPIQLFPSRSRIVSEPLGTVLIIAPWNYPFHLLFKPLVGAISAGCTAILKPSPHVPHVSQVLQDIIHFTFDERYLAVVQGDREVNKTLLSLRFDKIFFTGSPALGRVVMEAAAEHLTPVVLELGGKSPCIIAANADVRLAARKLAWGKSLNAGQTCIAPDYVLIDKTLRDSFVDEYFKLIHILLGEDASKSGHYCRMVDSHAFDRVSTYITGDYIGGQTDRSQLYIEPTIVLEPASDSPVMTEEIFGPVLPVLSVSSIDEAIAFINGREKPLALYFFGSVKEGRKVIGRTSSGGACINDVVMHIANDHLPFGGVGNSGMGQYHGRLSFDAFSHRRAVLISPRHPDLPFRYMPYRHFSLIRRLLG